MLGVIDAEKLDIYTLLLSQCSTPDTLIQTYSELATTGCPIQAQGSKFLWGKSRNDFWSILYSVFGLKCCVNPLKTPKFEPFEKKQKSAKTSNMRIVKFKSLKQLTTRHNYRRSILKSETWRRKSTQLNPGSVFLVTQTEV